MYDEDIAACRAIGAHGAALLPQEGTASSPTATPARSPPAATAPRSASSAPPSSAARKIDVFADETRPFLQGARLTAWETDAGQHPHHRHLRQHGRQPHAARASIQAVIVGADRIAANGDVANKIGTYGVAVLAKEHGIPFYVAAPWSTIDLATRTRRPTSRSSSASPPKSPTTQRQAADAARRRHLEPGLRRHPGQIRHRHHHRTRRPARPLP